MIYQDISHKVTDIRDVVDISRVSVIGDFTLF